MRFRVMCRGEVVGETDLVREIIPSNLKRLPRFPEGLHGRFYPNEAFEQYADVCKVERAPAAEARVPHMLRVWELRLSLETMEGHPVDTPPVLVHYYVDADGSPSLAPETWTYEARIIMPPGSLDPDVWGAG